MILKILIFLSFFALCNCCTNDMSPTDKVSEKIIAQFANHMRKQGLYAAGRGGGESGGKINLVDVCFDIHQVMDLKEARKLIVESSQVLLNMINSNANNANHFIKFPVTADLLHLSIIGEIPNDSLNYISSVSLVKGNIYYYRTDPNQVIKSLDDAHHEAFEEAVQILAEQEKCEQCT